MITDRLLIAMASGEIFASGFAINSPEGIYMTSSHIGRELIWVAVRGNGFHDWAIYCQWADEGDVDSTMRNGQKITNQENIRRLVPCDDGAMKLYRL